MKNELMYIPDEILKRAIKGGWVPRDFYSQTICVTKDGENKVVSPFGHSIISIGDLVLDPEFWQSLGKSLGWQEQPYSCKGCQTIGYRDGNHMRACPTKMRYGSWKDEAMRFYDHILQEKDSTDFWNSLITTN